MAILTYCNEDFHREWKFETVDGIPHDVTGATCQFVVMSEVDPTEVVLVCTEEDHITVGTTDGLFTLDIPASAFALDPTDYTCFVRATLDDGRVVLLEHTYLTVLYLPPTDVSMPEPEPVPAP